MEFQGFIEISAGLWYCLKDGTPWSNRKRNSKYFYSFLKPLKQQKSGYYKIKNGYKIEFWHRLVYEHFKGLIPKGEDIDHKNNIPSNNLIDNLETKIEKNNTRKRLKQKNNNSGYPGVCFNKNRKKFVCQIMVNKKMIYLGYFNNPLEAFICFLENKIYYHGWDSILPIT